MVAVSLRCCSLLSSSHAAAVVKKVCWRLLMITSSRASAGTLIGSAAPFVDLAQSYVQLFCRYLIRCPMADLHPPQTGRSSQKTSQPHVI